MWRGHSYLQLWNTILYFILAIVTTLGNAVVVLAVFKDPFKQLKKHIASYLIASLAVSNLVLVVGELLEAATNIVYGMEAYIIPGPPLVKAADILVCFAVSNSVNTILGLAIERYVLLQSEGHSMRKVTPRQVAGILTVLWATSSTIGLSRIAFQTVHSYRKAIGIIGVISVSTTMCLYLVIFFKIRRVFRMDIARASGENRALTISGLSAQRIRKRQMDAARTIILILASLIFLWTPTAVYLVQRLCTKNSLAYPQIELIYIIGLMNAAVDPGIYAFRTSRFRRAIAAILLKKHRKSSKHHQYMHRRRRVENKEKPC
ncbi:predicted protein [Nematostella vectensis]|uniref:G-protein coupled receptors family 1 profile domain-containing protein n=1 Tax=Nematostella vectensis TaxID=45351 RepID=A7S2T9_NEMVE|nr:predicted protein [Nematostella vectensis]|eukprot:XP_001634011.1 predicted protein [Nematostella vectensis]